MYRYRCPVVDGFSLNCTGLAPGPWLQCVPMSLGAQNLLYEQLARDVAGQIERGVLRGGERLPSVRQYARQRGCSVATVLSAYVKLEDGGLVEVRPKSGHFVRRRNVPVQVPRTPRLTPAPTRVQVSTEVTNLTRAMKDPSLVPMGSATLPAELLPLPALNQIMASLAREMRFMGASYEGPTGLRTLRRQLARRGLHWGVTLGEDEFIITNGAMEALHHALAATTRPGEAVAVESPAYFGLLQLLEQMGLKVVEVPAHAQTGMDLNGLEEVLRTQPIQAVLCTPNFCNPLGARMPDAAKAHLVEMLDKRGVPLIEDDVYGDLAFDGSRPRPAKAWDRTGNVLMCGSLSKTVAPGYRVGWLAPGRFQPAVEAIKFAHSIASPTPTQMAMAEFLSGGGYERHLRRLRVTLAQQVRQHRDAVIAAFPPGTRVCNPQGGFVVWVEMPAGVSAVELHRQALSQGIAVAPGPIFSARQRFTNCIRLNAGHPFSDRVAGAVDVLGRLAQAQQHHRSHRDAPAASCGFL